jgi:hypothetical protein
MDTFNAVRSEADTVPVLLVSRFRPLAHPPAVFPEGVLLVRSSLSCGQEGLRAKVNSIFLSSRSRFGASPFVVGHRLAGGR